MAKRLVATLSSKGQITLPQPVRELLRLGAGDYIRFKPVSGGVLVTKITLDTEEFSEEEWRVLGRLANQRGRRYKTAKGFLRDLERL